MMYTRSKWAVYLSLSLASTVTASSLPETQHGKLLTYNETTPSPSLRPESISVKWLSGANDGEYVTLSDKKDVVRKDIVTGKSTVLVPASSVPKDMAQYSISYDQSSVLFSSNSTKQYRYSSFSDYFIYNTTSKKSVPLVADQVGDIQYAALSPGNNNVIAFVRGNDMYLRQANGSVDRITHNGGPDMFHGVPDWVYEEEVIGGRSTQWFSPDGKFIAYLSINETGVGTYTIPYYMNNEKIAPPYPRELHIRYPKVGSKNPTVQFCVLDVETRKSKAIEMAGFGDESIIGEVSWLTKDHSKVMYRVFNRVQNQDKHVVVDVQTSTTRVVRQRKANDGWLENTASIKYVGNLGIVQDSQDYYVDLSDESGWMHIYLYPVNGGRAVQLTSGEWEVRAIRYVDPKHNVIYFTAAKRHSTESHLYSVSYGLKGHKQVKPLVDESQPAFWDASFSSKGGYYISSYQGPDVPYQKVYSVTTGKPVRTLVDNKNFTQTISGYLLPNITYFELHHPDGYSLNVMQRLPPNFDPSKRYPVLFTPYGGPNAQEVTKSWQSLGWASYIASDPELNFITYTVDNRGTGFKGRRFRSAVYKRLGKYETADQIWALKELVSRHSFINPDKVGMWGWSYGGYLTSKVVEKDSGAFTFGLITAPVTDWRFYDSVYTERYMGTLADNEAGYNETAVRSTDGFKRIAGGFAIMHGTGDDNVHYQNSAALVDLLVGGGVSPSKMKTMSFTDSDHSISYDGASAYLYKFLTSRLWDEVQRNNKTKLVHQWGRRMNEGVS